jgi:hypothetical protein
MYTNNVLALITQSTSFVIRSHAGMFRQSAISVDHRELFYVLKL